MYLFIEKGLRRGISYIAKKCSKVNNKYMKNYDFTKPSVFIKYLVEKNCMAGQWVVIFLMMSLSD